MLQSRFYISCDISTLSISNACHIMVYSSRPSTFSDWTQTGQPQDVYSTEWGGLSRSEATRRILIEWAKLRKGKEISAWVFKSSPRLSASAPSEGTHQISSTEKRRRTSNMVAKAASQVLDE